MSSTHDREPQTAHAEDQTVEPLAAHGAEPQGDGMLDAARSSLGSALIRRKMLRRRAAGGGTPAVTSPDHAFDLAQSGPGTALPYRKEMERSFGQPLDDVKVHAGGESAQRGLTAIGAEAATTGTTIAFQSSSPSKELVAHEVAHVVQHRNAGSSETHAKGLSQPGDAAESEADAAAERVARGERVQIGQASSDTHRSLLDDIALGAKNVYHDVAEGIGLESHDRADAARLAAFIDHGVYGPEDLVPPDTKTGGFEAAYDPHKQVLALAVRGGIDFKDGLTINTAGVIAAATPSLNGAAADGNTIVDADPAKQLSKRKAFVDQFHWTDEETWLANLNARAQAAWQGKHTFKCTRKGWEKQLANTTVKIDIKKGAKGKSDHLQVTTYKVPESGGYNVGAFVGGGNDLDAHNNTMTLSSKHNDDSASVSSLLRRSVYFANDSAALDASSKSDLAAFTKDFKQAGSDKTAPVQLIGRASSTGSAEHNKQLAQQRVDAVKAELKTAGLDHFEDRVTTDNKSSEGANEDAAWRRVDLVVAGGRGQFVAGHEFGHVLGLKDEYAVNAGGKISGTGTPTGTVVGHDQMAKAIGQKGAVAENNDNIMSLGSVVRPQHYATFGWALARLTGVTEWKI